VTGSGFNREPVLREQRRADISALCRAASGWLRKAGYEKSDDWYHNASCVFAGSARGGDRDFAKCIHRSIAAGARGPQGVVILNELRQPDVQATRAFHRDLSRLYDLTRTSRLRDWIRSFTG